MTDDQLLARARQLDPDALQKLHQRFYGPVARYVRFKVGDLQTAEDLSGEVFVRILEALRRGRSWQDSPQGWVMGIARHVVADHYRRKERRVEVKLSDQLAAAEEAGPAHQAMLNERQHRLMQAIAQLTDEQRDVILMRFMEGLDIESVAQAMHKTPGAVKALQYRATRALAEMMQDNDNE
jgi:RNA polymerase sigma-70 factor (ECF subfamily)